MIACDVLGEPAERQSETEIERHCHPGLEREPDALIDAVRPPHIMLAHTKSKGARLVKC